MMKTRTKFCKHCRKVTFKSELDAKIALSRRVWKDKGEVRTYKCRFGNWHLTSKKEWL